MTFRALALRLSEHSIDLKHQPSFNCAKITRNYKASLELVPDSNKCIPNKHSESDLLVMKREIL